MENTEQKTCQVEMHDGKPCGRPLYDGEKCVCHSEKEDKDVKLFQQELDKIFRDDDAGYYDLTRFIFPKDGYELPSEYKKDTYFTEVLFSGVAHFSDTTFQRHAGFAGVAFFGEALFLQARFCGKAIFIGANFAMATTFAMSQFQKRAYFGDTRFSVGVHFGGVRFNEGVMFNDSHISGADFSGAEFAGFTRFTEDEFCGTTRFSHATFLGETEFIWTVFKDDVSFTGCRIAEGARVLFAVGHTNQKMFLKKAFFESCILIGRNALVFHRVPLDTCHFVGTDVTVVDFADVTWHRKKSLLGFTARTAVSDEFGSNPDNFLITQLYRRLQANYINNYRYSEAGDFYKGEQEMMRKAKGKVGQYLSTNNAYRIISYYGESFNRPLFWLAFVLLLFPAVLLYDGINLNPAVQNPAVVETVNYEWSWSPGDFLLAKSDFWKAFVANFSLIAYSRSDIGKYLPETHTRLIVTIESLIVIALLAFFLLALRRQYKRKTF